MSLNVLICDTADELARLQYHFLRAGADLAVEVTTDAFRAVEMAARTRPDVVVCELDLEGLGGVEFIKRMRATSPDSKVLVWTVGRDPGRVAEVLTAGAAGYLTKEDSPTSSWPPSGTPPRGRCPSPPRWRGGSAKNSPGRWPVPANSRPNSRV